MLSCCLRMRPAASLPPPAHADRALASLHVTPRKVNYVPQPPCPPPATSSYLGMFPTCPYAVPRPACLPSVLLPVAPPHAPPARPAGCWCHLLSQPDIVDAHWPRACRVRACRVRACRVLATGIAPGAGSAPRPATSFLELEPGSHHRAVSRPRARRRAARPGCLCGVAVVWPLQEEAAAAARRLLRSRGRAAGPSSAGAAAVPGRPARGAQLGRLEALPPQQGVSSAASSGCWRLQRR